MTIVKVSCPIECEIKALLEAFPGLRLVPTGGDSIRIKGRLRFMASSEGFETIEDGYVIEMEISPDFPNETPLVWERDNRIPLNWHRNPGGALCLGAPTAIKFITIQARTLVKFVEKILVPYLYQRSYFEKYGKMPLGELAHGVEGLIQDFCEQFGITSSSDAISMAFLGSLRRRIANKKPCPCGEGKRLGLCIHRHKLNELRKILGRGWFKKQFQQIEKWQKNQSPNNQPVPTSSNAFPQSGVDTP